MWKVGFLKELLESWVFSQPDVPRIGDGAALTRKLSYYKLNFGTSKIVKLAIPPHYCQYAVCALHPQDTLCSVEEKFENTNFGLENKSYSVLFFQRVQVPYERIENLNR